MLFKTFVNTERLEYMPLYAAKNGGGSGGTTQFDCIVQSTQIREIRKQT